MSDPSYQHEVRAFDGIGLRPYAPCHLSALGAPGMDRTVSWIRRTRIDGDDWDAPEVPLGEETEAYRVRVMLGGTVLRETVVGAPAWTYGLAAQGADGAPEVEIAVAQLSATFGAGPEARIALSL